MASPVNHWKLGLFVVLGLTVAFSALVVLGASKFDKVVVPFVTYFDESVEGLEVGSPVKFRGVRIGSVQAIKVAPDRRHVEVTCAVDVNQLTRLGLRPENAPDDELPDGRFVPPDLRVQLVSKGITGVKFLQIDFFDDKTHPPPGLPFPTPKNYIPATPSTLKSLEESLVHTLQRLPELAEQANRILVRFAKLLEGIDTKKLTDSSIQGIEEARKLIEDLRATLKEVDVQKLSAKAESTMTRLDDSAARVDRILERLEKKDGMIDNMERSSETIDKELERLKPSQTLRKAEETMKRVDESLAKLNQTVEAVGGVARDSSHLGEELEATLKAIRDAAEAIRRLADTLERDPDSILKGRARSSER